MADKSALGIFLLAAFALETLCITYLMKFPELAPFASVTYFLSGIMVALLLLFLPAPRRPLLVIQSKPEKWFRWSLIAILSVFFCYFSILIMRENPIDFHYADMLPVIRTMDQRLLNGQRSHVYDRIPEIWGGSDPVYLPAMWLPYLPATFMHVDLRWMTVGCLTFVLGMTVMILPLKERSSLFVGLVTGILVCWLLFEDDTHGLIGLSEEGVVILYYYLLVLALYSGNIFFISVLASCCLLSRYALIGWLPAYFIYLLLNRQTTKAWIFSMTGLLFFLFLFILPFGWQAFWRLLRLPSFYVDFAKRVWKDSPETFLNYIGLAKFFGPGNIRFLHECLVGLSLSMPLLFMLACFAARKKIVFQNAPLAALKISLVIFYNFMDVPYMYLYFTSSLVSLGIVSLFVRQGINQRQSLTGPKTP